MVVVLEENTNFNKNHVNNHIQVEDDIIGFYKEIGNTFKKNYSGFQAWILSSNFEALKFIGLKPSKKIPLKNAALDVKLQNYEMYSGSKKASKQVD